MNTGEQILSYLHEYYRTNRIFIDLHKEDFNIYKIILMINYEVPYKEIEYKYDNHLTIIGNIYKIITEIDNTILLFYKKGGSNDDIQI